MPIQHIVGCAATSGMSARYFAEMTGSTANRVERRVPDQCAVVRGSRTFAAATSLAGRQLSLSDGISKRRRASRRVHLATSSHGQQGDDQRKAASCCSTADRWPSRRRR